MKITPVVEVRDVQLALVPDAIRECMLRNSLEFDLIEDNGKVHRPAAMSQELSIIRKALHANTKGLFCLITTEDERYQLSSINRTAIRVYFELRDDLNSFRQNFLVQYKLSSQL